MANETNIPPIIVSVESKYDDKAMKKAMADLDQVGDVGDKKITAAQKSFKQLQTVFGEMSGELAVGDKKVKKALGAVGKAFEDVAQKSEKYYSTRSVKIYKEKLALAEKTALERLDRLNKYREELAGRKGKDRTMVAYNEQGLETVYSVKGKGDKQTRGKELTAETERLRSYVRTAAQAALAEENASKRLSDANKTKAKSVSEYAKSVENARQKLYELVEAQNNTDKATGSLSTQFEKLNRAIKSFRISNLLSMAYALKRVWKFAISFVEASSSWIENLNLLEVTFADTADEAKDFVDQMSEIFGFDKNVISEYVSMFKQMANAMGQAEEAGTQMSKALTMVAIDISSLRNVELDTAAKDLASAIAGQVKPVRKYGFDITMYSIDELMDEIGYGSSSRTMSQANKQLARTILLIRQSKDAWGDLGKTINTFANQQRILNDQWTTAKRLLGNYFLGVVEVGDSFEDAWQKAGLATKAIWTFNGALMFLNELLGTRYGDTSSFNSGVTSVATVADEATDSIDELEEATESSLASFDKFNTMSTGDGATSTVNEALEALLDTEYQKYLTVFSQQAENVSMYAKDISQYISDIVDKAGGIENLKDGFGGLLLLVISLTNPLAGVLTLIAKASVEDQQMLTELIKGSADFFNIALQIGESFASIISDLMPFFKVLASALNFVSRLIAEMRLAPPILAAILTALTAIKALKLISSISKMTEQFTFLKSPMMGVLVALAAVILSVVDLIKNWDDLSTIGKLLRFVIIGIGSAFLVAFAVNKLQGIENASTAVINLTANLGQLGIALSSVLTVAAGITTFILGAIKFADAWDEMTTAVKGFGIALATLLVVLGAVLGAKKYGIAGFAIGLGAGAAAAGAVLAAMAATSGKASGIMNSFANGGYQTGGLFQAGESGPEWVGRQGRTSVIMNDEQMSDVMTAAVARGVAIGNQSGGGKTTAQRQAQPIVVNVDGKKLFEVVEQNGKRVGKKFTKVN